MLRCFLFQTLARWLLDRLRNVATLPHKQRGICQSLKGGPWGGTLFFSFLTQRPSTDDVGPLHLTLDIPLLACWMQMIVWIRQSPRTVDTFQTVWLGGSTQVKQDPVRLGLPGRVTARGVRCAR